ncbi:unnamed protein product, partial [Durusdinium trenchii]
GEVDFVFHGDNFLELAISNFPPFFVEEYVNLLLSGGACVNTPSSDRFTPLLSACSRGFGQIAETLLQHGANPETRRDNDDALRCALEFFKACVDYSSRERMEDISLAQACCKLRAEKIRRQTNLSPLAQARLRLSQVAIEQSLVSMVGFEVSKEKVLQLSGLRTEEVEEFGSELWAGWPFAFLSFEVPLPQSSEPDTFFCYARERILTYHLCKERPQRPKEAAALGSWQEDNWSVTYYTCDCYACCSWLYDFYGALDPNPWLSTYEVCKDRNQKWDVHRKRRGCRRVPVALSAKKASYSSRLARKMPAAFHGYHVQQALEGRHKKREKFQRVKQELWEL